MAVIDPRLAERRQRSKAHAIGPVLAANGQINFGGIMFDPFGRRIDYLRVSVTDRCDLRCTYCMPENVRFFSRDDLLSIEELAEICTLFVDKGIRKIRLTGGEPLVRRGLKDLLSTLGGLVGEGRLDTLTLTTNGTRLEHFAEMLAECSVRRINVSLDSLSPERFAAITRGGELAKVLRGLDAAKAAGLAIRINTVAMRGVNEDELSAVVAWCGAQGFDLCFIETMPFAARACHSASFFPVTEVRDILERDWTLIDDPTHSTGGPARYTTVGETGHRVGFISPLSHNFCASCNRIRLTSTGTLYTCLASQDGADLRASLRSQDGTLEQAIERHLGLKPDRHAFTPAPSESLTMARSMNVTGG